MNQTRPNRERELSFAERATWGKCPVCEATDGQWCHAEVGLQLGRKVTGQLLQTGEGVHLARLSLAPLRVREVPA